MLIAPLLNYNSGNHHNVLDALLTELKGSDLVVRSLQPSRMKLGDNTLSGVFDELVMTFPMVILSTCRETCFGGQGRKFMVCMLERKRETWIIKLDVRSTLLLDTGSGGSDDGSIFPSSMESQLVIPLICLTIVKNVLHLNSLSKGDTFVAGSWTYRFSQCEVLSYMLPFSRIISSLVSLLAAILFVSGFWISAIR